MTRGRVLLTGSFSGPKQEEGTIDTFASVQLAAYLYACNLVGSGDLVGVGVRTRFTGV